MQQRILYKCFTAIIAIKQVNYVTQNGEENRFTYADFYWREKKLKKIFLIFTSYEDLT